MIFIYITCSNFRQAEKIAKKILEKRLAACANIFPTNSLYLSKDKIVKGKEAVLILKTLEKNFDTIKEMVIELHNYETPSILKIKIDKVNEKYLNWLEGEIK